jgi:hypothetical protein
MPPELTLDERLAWVWSTVEMLAKLFDLDDDRLVYTVFEPLDIDATTALNEGNLTELVIASVLPEPVARELIAVGATVGNLIRQAHERRDYAASSLRKSGQWVRISGDCRKLLQRRGGQGPEVEPGASPDLAPKAGPDR